MGWNPPSPPPAVASPLWRCACEGCGAPLQVNQLQCTYCLRSTGVESPRIDITTFQDSEPRYAPGCLLPTIA